MNADDTFDRWWYHEGSGPMLTPNDVEEHVKRMCKIAWSTATLIENVKCAKVAETYEDSFGFGAFYIGKKIRDRWRK